MGRPHRTQAGGFVYHVLNRANQRAHIFDNAGDYAAFFRALVDAQNQHPMRLVAYCVLPNHWHLVLWPEHDRSLSAFVGWLTLTHTQRWHAFGRSAGSGHLYQGRFQSFAVEADEHFLAVCRYVERNALRAGLVSRAEDWPWSSLWQRCRGQVENRPLLSAGPIPFPEDWPKWVNEPQNICEEEAIRRCGRRGQPLGREAWSGQVVKTFGLESTLRPPGRPRKPSPAEPFPLFEENGS